MSLRWPTVAFVTFMLLSAPIAGSAQTTFGSVEGRVLDAGGAVLPGATVTVENAATGLVRTAVTNEQGLYRVLNLPPATYDIRAELAQFRPELRRQVVLTVGQTIELNFTLDVSTVEQSVEVIAGAPLLNTANTSINQSVDTRRVNELPLNGRDFTRLALTAPGAVQYTGGMSTLTFNGTTMLQSNYLLDGVDATDINSFIPSNGRERGARLQTASVESLQEVEVLAANYTAEHGRSVGAVVNAVTKSGTNTFHGSGFGFLRDDKFDARNYFDPPQKPPFSLKQFGGGLNGPIRRDRLFFFANYEGSRKELGSTATGTVPTAAFRARVDPALEPILRSMPLPTEPTANPDVGIVRATDTTRIRENLFSTRIDFRPTQRDHVFSRYNVQDSVVDGPLYFVNGRAGAISGQRQHVPIRTQSSTTSVMTVLRSNLMNEAKFGLNHISVSIQELDPGSPPGGIPLTTITGMTVTPGIASGAARTSRSLEFIDNLSWFSGAHTLKAGVNLRRLTTNPSQLGIPTMLFTSLDDFAANRPSQATFATTLPPTFFSNWMYSAYLQDDYRVARHVTLNLGLRYDYNTPYKVRDGQVQNFDLQRMALRSPSEPIYSPDRNNFAPRLGVIYDPGGEGRTVIRAGYGIYYIPMAAESVYQGGLFANVPGTTTLNRTTTPDLRYPLPTTTAGGLQFPPSRSAIDPSRQDNYSHQWTINLARQFGANTGLTVGYVANRLRNNLRTRPTNLIDPRTGTRPDPRYATITIVENTARGKYDALQTQLNRRFAGGLTFSAAYTWSKNRDNYGGLPFIGPQNPNDYENEWAPAFNDVPHNFMVNAIWELPFGPDRRFANGDGIGSRLLEGWQVNVLAMAHSGYPYSVFLGTSVAGTGWFVNQRPDRVPGVSSTGPRDGPTGWLNPAAFAMPAPGTYGNLPPNSERGPRFAQVDASLFRNINTGRHKVQLRVEVFNVLNTALFANPNPVWLSGPSFGRIFSTFAQTEGFGTARQVQFGVRYTF